VLVGARDADRGARTADEFGGRVLVLDVTDADTIATAAAAVPDLDVLINNAGISLDTGFPLTGGRHRFGGRLPIVEDRAQRLDRLLRLGRDRRAVVSANASGAMA